MEPGALGRRRRRGGAFSIARLFANGEAGGVYDPSDLTAEKVAWRRNLLAWSQDFDNAAWTKLGSSVTANATTAPDGTATADRLVEDSSTGTHQVRQDFTTAAVPYVFSVYAKADTRSWLLLYNTTAGYGRAFNLATGQIGTASIGTSTATIEVAGNGWYRCTLTGTATAASNAFRIYLNTADDMNASYVGNGTSGAFIWGAQLEVGSTATAYQRITDFTSDFLAAFPTHGLYQDAAGTTPVTALGQPVGLVLDQSRGSAGTNGSRRLNLLTFSEQFDNAAWTKNAATVSANATTAPDGTTTADTVTASSAGTYRTVRRVSAGLVANATFVYSVAAKRNTSDWIFLRFYDSPSGDGAWFNVNTGTLGTVSGVTASITALGDGWYRCTISRVVGSTITFNEIDIGLSSSNNSFSAASGDSVFLWGADFRLSADATVAPTYQRVTDTWYNAQAGVHAIQPTNSSRPLLDGRVNLLTFSEQFDNAVWTKADTTVTANATTAPNGTTTADSLLETATTAAHAIYQAASVTSGASYQWTGYVRANGRTRIRLVCAATSAVLTADYNISAITATVAAGSGTVSIESIGSGWFRLFATATATATGTGYWQANLLDDNGNLSYLGDVTKGMFIWGADLRLAADAAYPYQRVAAATDYADVGVPRSFAFDGFDDSLYTASNMDLSGTDKVTVLAGVRKLSDAARGMLMEHSSAYSNAGTFGIDAPTSVGPNYFVAANGTTLGGYVLTTFAAPVSNVISALFNLAGATLPAQIIPRVNGLTPTLGASGSTGVNGNFSSQVFYIGRRFNTTLPFNGKAYQLIVRGALTDAATLAQAERYVGAKTGLYI